MPIYHELWFYEELHVLTFIYSIKMDLLSHLQWLLPESDEELFRDNKSVFLISKSWWDNWTTDSEPGPIDNNILLENNRPRLDLEQGSTHICLPKMAWDFVVDHHGGGPPVEVFVVAG